MGKSKKLRKLEDVLLATDVLYVITKTDNIVVPTNAYMAKSLVGKNLMNTVGIRSFELYLADKSRSISLNRLSEKDLASLQLYNNQLPPIVKASVSTDISEGMFYTIKDVDVLEQVKAVIGENENYYSLEQIFSQTQDLQKEFKAHKNACYLPVIIALLLMLTTSSSLMFLIGWSVITVLSCIITGLVFCYVTKLLYNLHVILTPIRCKLLLLVKQREQLCIMHLAKR